MEFSAGIKVRARGLTWTVIAADPAGPHQRLRLRCIEGDMDGLEWDILDPTEPIDIQSDRLRPHAPAALETWRLFHIAALLDQAPGPGAMLATTPGRVTVEPYQLVPLLRALELPRPRLLLADGVGLGKTIQACLIATELIARRQAHRIIVVTPSGPLLAQWEQELRLRFGLRFTVLADAAALRAQRRRLERGGNPFQATPLCLTSLDFAKQEMVLEELERTCWDLAIIDEAHHCIAEASDRAADRASDQPRDRPTDRPAHRPTDHSTDYPMGHPTDRPTARPTDHSTGRPTDHPGGRPTDRYWDRSRSDTQRRRLAEVLASRADGLLLLTATPHDGHDAHFASLMALLDPSLVDGHGRLSGRAYRRHIVRRLKAHISDPETGRAMFQPRKVTPVPIDLAVPEAEPVRAFHRALTEFVVPRLRRSPGQKRPSDSMAFVSLLKRSVSTIRACANTLRVVADRYAAAAGETEAARRERARSLAAYRRRVARYGVLDNADANDAALLEAEFMAATLHDAPSSDIESPPLAGLLDLIRLADAAEAADPKLSALLTEIRLIRAAHPLTNILVYTEYADSLDAAVQRLRGAAGIVGDVLAISGAAEERQRGLAAERCATEDGIILVSTDSLAEGLNLHRRCFHLIHLDLPYNPNRLEQRNGRIDRYGQRQDPDIRYLFLSGTFEENLLLRLIAKYEKARACLTFMPDTLGVTAEPDAWTKGLVAGFAEETASLFPDPPSPVRTLDRAGEAGDSAAYQALRREIDRAYDGFEPMAVRHGWLADPGMGAGGRGLAVARIARDAGLRSLGGITPAEFVRRVIAEEGPEGSRSGRPITAADAPRDPIATAWSAASGDPEHTIAEPVFRPDGTIRRDQDTGMPTGAPVPDERLRTGSSRHTSGRPPIPTNASRASAIGSSHPTSGRLHGRMLDADVTFTGSGHPTSGRLQVPAKATESSVDRSGHPLSGRLQVPVQSHAPADRWSGHPTSGRLQVPVGWTQGLEGLPGFDPLAATLDWSEDLDQFLDKTGRPMGFLGAAHPLVRRAIGQARRTETQSGQDRRVAVAWSTPATALSVLLTFAVEIRARDHIALRRLIAVLLPRQGEARAMDAPAEILALAARPPPEAAREVQREAPSWEAPWAPPGDAPPDAWDRWFADWVPDREAAAINTANQVAERMEAAFAATHGRILHHQIADLDRWLETRAADLCGTSRAPPADLFGRPPPGPAWRHLANPLDRLAGCAADPATLDARRRDAAAIVSHYKRLAGDLASRADLSEVRLPRIGLLMLVPADLAHGV